VGNFRKNGHFFDVFTHIWPKYLDFMGKSVVFQI
jgi:hypothetical protein